MKKIMLTLLCAVTVGTLFAQEKIYNEEIDAMQQIRVAVQLAKDSDRYVFCQVGGNWCPWCIRFAGFVANTPAVFEVMQQNFVYIHINYSKANKNMEAMKYLGNPARFGFPVFVILDGEGRPIHIQNSAYLEEDKGYGEKKVLDFLNQWTPAAVTTLSDR